MKVFLDGAWVPEEEAKVPVFDRGFVFGDGVYEVVPVYSRRPFRLGAHLRRLQRSLGCVAIENPYSFSRWQEIVIEAAASSPLADDHAVYIEVTRGKAPREHAFPHCSPTVVVFTLPQGKKPPRPARTVTLEDNRWGRCDIKTISLLPNLLLREEARKREADEAILIKEGFLTEGTSSSVVVVENGVVLAPPAGPRLLPSVTQALAFCLLEESGVKVVRRPISRQQLFDAQEVWLLGSVTGIWAVGDMDGQKVGGGEPGPLFDKAHALYEAAKEKSEEEIERHLRHFPG